MSKILFPDNIHINKRNFQPFLTFLKEQKIDIVAVEEYDAIKSLYGDYKNHKEIFLNYYMQLKQLQKDEIYNKEFAGKKIFLFAQAELLSYLITKENWYSQKVGSDSYLLFNKMYDENKEELLLNLSVTLFWLDYWREFLREKSSKQIKYATIFSGSLIYQKTLIYLLENTATQVFVVEHFLTGNDYYFEEKYTHIANNSDIKFLNYYERLQKEYINFSLQKRNNLKKLALQRFYKKNNKNVQQPLKHTQKLSFSKESKQVLILGQVINDFSILETLLPNINSLDIYKNIIFGILKETDYNIVFKAHPWERKKIHLKTSFTKEKLTAYIEQTFSEEEQKRFELVEDFNLEDLIEQSDHIVAICSQSLLEASFLGKKTHQIGYSFFGNRGFTYNYHDEFEFLKALKDEPKVNLTLQEYANFIDFLSIFLTQHLVHNTSNENLKLIKKMNIKNINTDKGLFLNLLGLQTGKNLSLWKYIIFVSLSPFLTEKKKIKLRNSPRQFFEDIHFTPFKILSKLY